jgi:hypothetical protein
MTQVYEFPLLTEAEYNAMSLLRTQLSISVDKIEDKSYVDCMRTIIPGRSIFNKLIKKDLCYETIEDPMEDGTEFTPSIDLTDKGVAMCHELEKYMK